MWRRRASGAAPAVLSALALAALTACQCEEPAAQLVVTTPLPQALTR